MPDITHADYISGGSANRRWFVLDACEGRRSAAVRAMVEGLSFLRMAEEAGFDLCKRCDFASGLLDDISDCMGRIEKDLDNEHMPSLPPIDVAELEAVRDKLEREWKLQRMRRPGL